MKHNKNQMPFVKLGISLLGGLALTACSTLDTIPDKQI